MAERGRVERLIDSLAGRDVDDPVAEALAWHAYASDPAPEISSDLQNMRRALHEGTPAEVIALVSLDVRARARAAAREPGEQDPTPPEAA